MHLTMYFIKHMQYSLKKFFILPSLHPLFFCAITYMGGIIWADMFSATLIHIWMLIPSIILLCFAYKTTLPSKLIRYVLYANFFIAGSIFYFWHLQHHHHFHQHAAHISHIRGTITALEKVTNNRFSYYISVAIEKYATSDQVHNWHTISGNILIYSNTIRGLHIGDYVECKDIHIKEPHNPSFARYLLRKSTLATLFIPAQKVRRLSRSTWNIRSFVIAVRNRVYNALQQKTNPHAFHLVSSIFFGNNQQVKKELETTKQDFKLWGISHYLARSGLHVVIFICIWQFLFALLPIRRCYAHGIMIFIVALYSVLSWSSVSFERALLMFLLSHLVIWLGYASHHIHIISLATLLILIHNPFHLFFLDFQLSFGYTLALMWFNHVEAAKKHLS